MTIERRLALRVKLAARPLLPTLWYENEAGDRWPVDLSDPTASPPEGFVYQWSRFPYVLRETCFRTVEQKDVDACDHPVDMLKPDLGLIEGLEGRECMKCHGTQVKNVGDSWPEKWEAHGSREVMSGESTWPDELVLAMVRPSPAEMVLALERHGEEPRLLGMDDAIILAATSCERCLNALLWRYGCNDGYPPYSPEWDKVNTKCAICETPSVWNWLMNETNVAYGKMAARLIKIDSDQIEGVLDDFRAWASTQARIHGNTAPAKGEHLGMVTLQTPWGEGRDILVAFLPSSGFGGGLGFFQGQPLVKVFFDDELHWGSLGEPATIKILNKTLQHEITHALDRLEGVAQGANAENITRLDELGVSPEQYFNDPSEVRAYMRTIYEEIAPMVLHLLQGPLAEKWGLGKIITVQLRSSPTWKAMEPHLHSPNRNRILKGLVTEFNNRQASVTWHRVAAITTRQQLEDAGRDADPAMLAEVHERSRKWSEAIMHEVRGEGRTASLVTPNQLKYIRTLLKQRGVTEPPGLDKWTALNASKLIGGLQDRRLTPTFDQSGRFRGWETKKATLAERVAAHYLEAKLTPQQRGWERRKEQDDFTEKNIPPEHLRLWRSMKNRFKGTPDERAEQFMEYLEEHPGESDEMLQQHADRDVAKLVREQEKERREQVKLEKECDKNQTKYEDAWYKEQERQTREKGVLRQLKEKAENVCQNCPTCDRGGEDMIPFAASQRMAVSKRKPVPYTPPPKKTLEEIARKAVESMVGSAMGKLKGLESLEPVSVSGQDSFSDGVYPNRAWGSTGYSFTIRFPTKVLTKGVFEVALDEHDLKENLLYEDRDEILEKTDPAVVEAAVRAVNVADVLERGLEDAVEVPRDDRGLSEDVVERITDAASQKVEQSISAWTEDEPELELPEYPDVYLRWRVRREKVEYGRAAQAGNVWRIPVKVSWDVKPDAWTLDAHPRPGDWNHMHLASDLAARVAARYKKKHHIKTQEGKDAVVYEYSEGQVARRNAEKAKRLEALRKSIGNLRSKVKRDLKSSDPEKALTALAVALIDHTYERVGNDGSAKERGHYGVTGWQKSHVSFGRGHASVKYTGKSGVEQKKKVSDKAILTALRNAYEACEDDEGSLFEHAGGKITAEKVNSYLEAFNVSAKDLRGFHANREMQERLGAVRAKGGKLPEDKKERQAKLKEEFKKALEETAEAVGHEPSTLKSQYLVPGLESQFLKDGTVMTKMKAAAFVYDDGCDCFVDTETGEKGPNGPAYTYAR